MKTISLKEIKKLRPCQDRLDNYVKHYGDRVFTPRQFMGLKHITHEDKLWVVFRLLPKKDLYCAAADFSESVLSIYETKYPNDTRPREAIKVVRLYANGEATLEQVRNAAYAASAANDAANAANDANDAAYAAAYASRAAAYAASAAANDASAASAANAAHAADSAAYAAAANDADARLKQRKLCRTILLRYWR